MSIGRYIFEAVKHYYRLTSAPNYRELDRLGQLPRYAVEKLTA